MGYDYLVVAAGLSINYDKVKGLSEALQDVAGTKVSTIYSYETADKTWDLIRSFDGKGEAVFTQPFGVIKCAGGKSSTRSSGVNGGSRVAPQKINYMADSYWKSQNTPHHSTFTTGMPTMFGQPDYSKALNALREQKGISAEFNTNLVEVRPRDKVAVFEKLAGEDKGQKVEREFGMLHVTPPMGPLEWIKKSPLADAAGWVDVNQGTLQHNKFENVFALGDASSLPTSKVSPSQRSLLRDSVLTTRPPLLSPPRPLYSHTTSSRSWTPARSARQSTTATPRARSSSPAASSSSPSSNTASQRKRRSAPSPTSLFLTGKSSV